MKSIFQARVFKNTTALQKKQKIIDTLNSRIVILKNTIATQRGKIHTNKDTIDKLNARLELRAERAQQVKKDGEFNTIMHNSAEGMDHFFGAIGDQEIYLEFGRAVGNLFKEKGVSATGKDVVDFGIGPGIALKALLADFQPSRIVGLDFSKNAISIAQKHIPDGEFYTADIYKPTEGEFDIVLCMEVLEHLEYPQKALMNISKNVRDNGKLVLTVPQGRID